MYGADGTGPTAQGSSPPYQDPSPLTDTFGGYVAEIGGWWTTRGCGGTNVHNDTDITDANTNFFDYNDGAGAGAYWFPGGPGFDPHYNGSTNEAYTWGQEQAQSFISAYKNYPYTLYMGVLWLDVEGGSGWAHVYTWSGCTPYYTSTSVAHELDYYTYEGFTSYVKSKGFVPGVYSRKDFWNPTFGTYYNITGTYEWTRTAAS